MGRAVRKVFAVVVCLALFTWLPTTRASAHNGYPPFDEAFEFAYPYDFVVTAGGRVQVCYPNIVCYDLGPIGARGTPAATANCDLKMHVFVVGYGNRL
jgi:hypothetical protein